MDENWKVYINGDLVAIKDATISVFDRGGDGVFERLRCYDGKIFKLEEYVQRFFRSARAIHIEMPIAHAEMKQAIKDTVRANGFTNAHIKPIVTRGYAWNLGLDPRNTTAPNIIIIARPIAESMYGEAYSGLRLAVVSVRKIPPFCFDPRVKSLTIWSISWRARRPRPLAPMRPSCWISRATSQRGAPTIFSWRDTGPCGPPRTTPPWKALPERP